MRALAFFRSAVVIGLVGAIMFGCGTTAAHKRAEHIKDHYPTIMARAKSCTDGIRDSPKYQQIVSRMSVKPTLQQLTDTGYASDQEVQLMIDHYNEVAICRERFIVAIMDVNPGAIPIYTKGWQEADAVLAELILRKVTYGEANKQRAGVFSETNSRISAQIHQLDMELTAAHNNEMQQRQQAFFALSQWSQQQQMVMQNQQMLNAINRPITTNCFRVGNSVQCTSY